MIDPEKLAILTPDELAEVDALLQAKAEDVIWEPQPGPQTLAYESEADVIGYGGAAGSGKSDLAVGLALTKHQVVQVFRREGTELRALIDRTAEIVGSREGLGGKPPVWRNPSANCKVIEFCSVPHLGDETKFQGRAKDFLVFDEAANFLEQQVRFVMGWVRTTDPTQKCTTLLTFNPPTSPEGRWVIEFFAPWLDKKHPDYPEEPGKLRWYATIAGRDVERPNGKSFKHEGETILPQSRTFIPGRVKDNKYLWGTGYVRQLQALPEPLRSQMLHGDFQAGLEDDPYQVIKTAWVEAAMERWERKLPLPPMDSLGVDVALGGRDDTVLARRHGMWFDEPIVHPGETCVDGPTIAGFVIAAQRDQAVIHLDLFGVGAQPYGHLMRAQQQVIGVNVGDPAHGVAVDGGLRFRNLRSELVWRMREALDPAANTGIALPPNRRLLADLCAFTWKAVGPMIVVESRDEIVKRIGRSPDTGSAYILALMDAPKRQAMDRLTNQRRREYDPYSDI